MQHLIVLLLATATSVSAVGNDKRQTSSCASSNTWQNKYCCPGTFLYNQDSMDSPICCAGDAAENYYFNTGPTTCTSGTSMPITAFDASGNLMSGSMQATSSGLSSETTEASSSAAGSTAPTTSQLSTTQGVASSNPGVSSSPSLSPSQPIASTVQNSPSSTGISTTSSGGAAAVATRAPLGLYMGALGVLALV